MFVPAKTPRPIVDRLYQEMQKTIADASVKERLGKMGIEPLVMSQPEFERYFKADVLDTEKLAQAAGIEKQ
jgi:tripartite-type tricarboxylate transporter receptor subunit TctC